MLIFFWDPMSPQPHDSDVKALVRIAVVWNIPIACNRTSADYLITSPLLGLPGTARTPLAGSFSWPLLASARSGGGQSARRRSPADQGHGVARPGETRTRSDSRS